MQATAGIERWRSVLLMHVYKMTFDWGSLRPGAAAELPERLGPTDSELSDLVEPAPCSPSHFDSTDWKIADALREDGRERFQSIVDRLGTNESSVCRRFERLTSGGCRDIDTLVAAPALGMGAETLLIVKVAPRALDDVARELARHPAVRFLAATLDDNSLFCEVIMPSTDDLHAFITSTLSRLDGVKGWAAAMELLFLKRGFADTPWWRSQVSYVEVGGGQRPG